MNSRIAPYVPDQSKEWRRLVVGFVLRSVLTVVGYALGGFVIFAIVTLFTELVVDDVWVRVLYPLYLLLGALVGANLGVATAIRREALLATESSAGILGLLVDRTIGEMAIPDEGIETERLRALAELEPALPSSGGTLTRMFAGVAMARAFEQAGIQAFRGEVRRTVREAEARGDTVVSQEALRESARSGIARAFAAQLDVGLKANQRFNRVASALMVLSLPVLAILFG